MQPTSVLPLIGTISLAVAIAIGAIDLPLWALVFVALFIRWCASIYNASRNQLLPVNPLQLRLTLMDRDFNESGTRHRRHRHWRSLRDIRRD